MILDINEGNITTIKNPVFRAHAQVHLDNYKYFKDDISRCRLPLQVGREYTLRNTAIGEKGVGIICRNNGHSYYINRISPACLACRGEEECATLYISLRCNRNCFYCFTCFDENYEYFQTHTRDYQSEFQSYLKHGFSPRYIGLTGGEPLLHQKESLEFFHMSEQYFPGCHKRLYTSGGMLDVTLLQQLQKAGLDEIRFSIKLEDPLRLRQLVLEQILLATKFIPAVMVEMPVIPGTLREMKELLMTLDEMDIFGINLLEFCYPMTDNPIFQKNFSLRWPPYHVLYEYGYGAGLPVADSEADCLELLDFAVDQGLKMGVHYCSLENKFTGQIWAQNKDYNLPYAHFSKQDFFLKVAMVFGTDVKKAIRALDKDEYIKGDRCIIFHPSKISKLRDLDIEIGLSYNVIDQDDNGKYLRELKLSIVHPKQFDFYKDI